VNCDCKTNDSNAQLLEKIANIEQELVTTAKRLVKSAGDPFSGVINFLAERPEGTSMPGFLVNRVLLETFGEIEQIPGLIRILSGHVKEIVRQSNAINIINEHPNSERWGNFIIKQKEKIKFEVGLEKGKLLLHKIEGLIGVEQGIELPLEKILVQPPKLIVTVKLGLLHPQKVVDI